MKTKSHLLWDGLARHACLWAVLGLLAVLTFGPPLARAAVTEAWVHRYSNVVSNSNDQAVKVVRDAAGDIIVTGTTDGRIHGSDMLTIKYSSADGSVLWQQRYNGPANLDDGAMAVAVDGSANVVVTGYSHNGTNSDYYTAKYAAADGALIWEQRYNGLANDEDVPAAMAVDGSGNVAVTGYSSGTNGYYDYYTAKYAAADGALVWEKRYDGPANAYDLASAVAVDNSGNVLVTGRSDARIVPGVGLVGDAYTAKYAAADGALLWEKRFTNAGASAVAEDGSGNVVVTGSSYNGTNGDYYTAKYAAEDGALLWEKRYNGPANGDDGASAVAVDGSGNVVVTGYSTGTNGHYDYYTAKYAAADGALLWEKRYNGPGNYNYDDQARALALDGSGNVAMTGYSLGTNGYYDYYTAKYAAADGALVWEKRYDGLAFAVAVDGNGDVVVTGYSGTWPNYDYYTAKYAAADAALLWEQRYTGLSRSYNEPKAVAVDGNGNVVVTGYSEGNGSSGDYYTARYAAANGALLWEKRSNGGSQALAVDGSGNVVVTGSSQNGPPNYETDFHTAKYAATDGALLWEKRSTNGSALAVAVDGSGNVVVTGYSSVGLDRFGDPNHDYYTVKYAAADGALLWEKRYDGPDNWYDFASAVAVDGSGNVVVTGSSYNAPPNYNHDYYTVKYAAADGALLWEKRYNSPGNDYAQAVAVDGAGNVVVTGVSDYQIGCSCVYEGDYYTAKYAAADGALLWEKRYNGPANSFDQPQAVAVDGSGNVLVTGLTGSSYLDGDCGGSCSYSGGDYYTVKYAAADGALLWEKRYNGPANGDDGASTVVVDSSGNVVVTGTSTGTNGNYDYYTAKYAAVDGALLWEQRYNAPANGGDSMNSRGYGIFFSGPPLAVVPLHSLALGPNGMVAITGNSSGDYATVVYRDDVYPISIALVPTGVRLRFVGIPGRSYTIERAPAVPGPWTTLNTQTAPSAGLLEFLDAPPPPGSAFYRTVQP